MVLNDRFQVGKEPGCSECSMRLPEERGCTTGGSGVSRREFLKLAGIAGAVIGTGAGLGVVLAACGEEETTSTAGATTTGAAATTTTAGATTTVSAEAEMGREIKIGYVSPTTGALALFGIPDAYCVERWKEAAGDGLVFGDGKKHPVNLIVRDTQSDVSRAAQVAGDLISNDKVDIIMACSTPDTTNPVADQAEATATPCITADAPMEAFYFGRGAAPDTPFKWTYHVFWGFREVLVNVYDVYPQVPTNKIVGALWPNNTDGNAFRDAFTPGLEENGYTVVDAGPYSEPNEDFTSMISQFRKGGCEILVGAMIPPDFGTLLNQTKQQGFYPKIIDVAKPLLFPQGVEALGELGNFLLGNNWWHPTYPFKSSLTGETCQQIADDFEQKTGNQWTAPLLHYIVFEMAVDSLKRTQNLDDKESIIQAIASMNMKDTLAGPIDFTAPVQMGTSHPVVNVVSTPLYGGQWVKGETIGSKWPYDLKIIGNASAPMVTVQGKMEPYPA